MTDLTRSQALRLRRVSLATIAWEFFKIGITGFGGGLQARFFHLAVNERGWLNEEEFAEVNATASLAPGGNASNVGLEIARRLRGVAGMVIAFLALILPGSILMLCAGELYSQHKSNPILQRMIEGLEAAATALILYSVTKLDLKSWRWTDYVLAGVTTVSMAVFHHPLWAVLPILGLLSWGLRRVQGR